VSYHEDFNSKQH